MTNEYLQLKRKHQEEINNFPIGFAFSDEQFHQAMVKQLGLNPNDIDKVVSIGGGGFIRKTDIEAFQEMLERQDREMKSAMDASDEFIFQMFSYELDNHEYSYTFELEPTLSALGLLLEHVEQDSRLKKGLVRAINNITHREIS